jgi:hypothetical protein
MDPQLFGCLDPYWESESGSGLRSMENGQNLCKKSFVPLVVGMFFDLLSTAYRICHVQILLFVTLKSDQDADPHGSVLVWLPGHGSGSALRKKNRSGSGCAMVLTTLAVI